jgi:hypothetical protein
MDRRLGGPQSLYGRCGEEETALSGIEPRSSSPLPNHYTDWAISAPWGNFYEHRYERLGYMREFLD